MLQKGGTTHRKNEPGMSNLTNVFRVKEFDSIPTYSTNADIENQTGPISLRRVNSVRVGEKVIHIRRVNSVTIANKNSSVKDISADESLGHTLPQRRVSHGSLSLNNGFNSSSTSMRVTDGYDNHSSSNLDISSVNDRVVITHTFDDKEEKSNDQNLHNSSMTNLEITHDVDVLPQHLDFTDISNVETIDIEDDDSDCEIIITTQTALDRKRSASHVTWL